MMHFTMSAPLECKNQNAETSRVSFALLSQSQEL